MLPVGLECGECEVVLIAVRRNGLAIVDEV
jgi:hypothetical protein